MFLHKFLPAARRQLQSGHRAAQRMRQRPQEPLPALSGGDRQGLQRARVRAQLPADLPRGAGERAVQE